MRLRLPVGLLRLQTGFGYSFVLWGFVFPLIVSHRANQEHARRTLARTSRREAIEAMDSSRSAKFQTRSIIWKCTAIFAALAERTVLLRTTILHVPVCGARVTSSFAGTWGGSQKKRRE